MWEQITEFFTKFTSYKDWPPRWKCGYWSDFHGWLYIISDLMVWLAYFLIPLVILKYALKRKNIRFYKAYIYFAAFILLCGGTHFMDALMFWFPYYRINAVLRFTTGIASLVTVYHLIKILPQAFSLRTGVELETEISFRKRIQAELALSNEKLVEANHGLEAFVYIASHDLQEPLRKIRTYSSMIEEKSVLDENGTIYVQKIEQSSERMRKLIDGLLALSTINHQTKLEPVDTAMAVQHALNDLELKIAEKKAVINVGKLPRVMGNESYLTQLFNNLINNALKFSERPPVIDIFATEGPDMVSIHVKDNGIGIPEHELSRIFIPFNRLHSKQVYEGSGIGLAICKKVADIHHATLSAKSSFNEGTVLTISFPAVSENIPGKPLQQT